MTQTSVQTGSRIRISLIFQDFVNLTLKKNVHITWMCTFSFSAAHILHLWNRCFLSFSFSLFHCLLLYLYSLHSHFLFSIQTETLLFQTTTLPSYCIPLHLKEKKIGSFSNSPRGKQLSFYVFESIEPISGLVVALLP